MTRAPVSLNHWQFDYEVCLVADNSNHYVSQYAGNNEIRQGKWTSMEMPGDSKQRRAEEEEEYPAWMRCSISLERLVDPVVAADGHTYSRKEIQKWLDSGKRTSPRTNTLLSHLNLTTNWLCKSQIQEWIEERKTKQVFEKQLTALRGELLELPLLPSSASSSFSLDFFDFQGKVVQILYRIGEVVAAARSKDKCIMSVREAQQLRVRVLELLPTQCSIVEDALSLLERQCAKCIEHWREMLVELEGRCKDLEIAKSVRPTFLKSLDEALQDSKDQLDQAKINLLERQKEMKETSLKVPRLQKEHTRLKEVENAAIKRWQEEGMKWAVAGGFGENVLLKCSEGHTMSLNEMSANFCDRCSSAGTHYRCSNGCDYDVCRKCWEKEKKSTAGTTATQQVLLTQVTEHLSTMREASEHVKVALTCSVNMQSVLAANVIGVKRAVANEESDREYLAEVKENKKLFLERDLLLDRLIDTYSDKREHIANQLACAADNARVVASQGRTPPLPVRTLPRSKSSSSSSSSSFSLSSSSSFTRGAKRARDKTDFMSAFANTPPIKRHKSAPYKIEGQWLFEEGMKALRGYDFATIDYTRGRTMMEAAAACGNQLGMSLVSAVHLLVLFCCIFYLFLSVSFFFFIVFFFDLTPLYFPFLHLNV